MTGTSVTNIGLLRTLEYYVLAVCAISMKFINILRLETPLKITKNVCTNPRWRPRGGSNYPNKIFTMLI